MITGELRAPDFLTRNLCPVHLRQTSFGVALQFFVDRGSILSKHFPQ
jgi:hypothetical protein